jgi:hypothetical protein
MSAPSDLLSWNEILKPCHPERSLAKSEAIRQTEPKDPCYTDATESNERHFRTVFRFFAEHDPDQCPVYSREAAACESPEPKCQVEEQMESESRRDVTLAACTTKQ